ncbi:MAG: transcriptional regulator [Candidatus Nanopelagicaceae bacterium]|nr:transcriptional regulator [Candidatus Nanopelagicaceae bacterium]
MSELRNTIVVKNEEIRTRELIARAILENGPATATALASRLGITPAGIRRHLDSLVSEGTLEAREPKIGSSTIGRGRPAKVFVMTDFGRSQFEHSYDDLAISALRFMASTSGSVTPFAQHRAQEMERKLASDGQVSVDELVTFLNDEGYAASSHQMSVGIELCQHHCPIAHVASEFPEICEAETQLFSKLLGTHVQRLATVAHGDGVCTTFVPLTLTSTSK